jgi:hypothetical protein
MAKIRETNILPGHEMIVYSKGSVLKKSHTLPAILHPLKYPSTMTRKKANRIIAAIWIYHIVLCAISAIGWNNYDRDNGKVCDFFKTLPLLYTIISCPGNIFVSLISINGVQKMKKKNIIIPVASADLVSFRKCI